MGVSPWFFGRVTMSPEGATDFFRFRCQMSVGCCAMSIALVSMAKQPNDSTRCTLSRLVIETSAIDIAQQLTDI
jgi:hypothetical protein